MEARSVVGALLLLLAGLAGPACAAERPIAIRAGQLIDTVAGRTAGAQLIIVRDGVIADVGPTSRCPPTLA